MKKLIVQFFAIAALLLLFKAGCSDINRSGLQDQVEGIKSVVPAQGPYGARVLIGGKGFTDDPEVLFNGIEAEIESASDSTIITRVPLEANTGPVEVIAGQDILSGPTFTIDSTRSLFLIIDEIRPSTGRYRDTMYIAGSGFDPVPEENGVYLNEIRSPVLEASDSLLMTTVPVGASSGLITVIANQDTAIGPQFELLRHQITDIDPASGRVGTQVRISGSDFSDQISENSVFFNGVQAEIVESSASQIVTSVPFEATSGPVSVAVRRDTVEGPTFSVQELQILEVAPLSGEVGTDVLISGNGFSPNIENNTIQFNGVEAPVLSASETELQTQVPEGATNGNIMVSVNGMTVTGPEFTVEEGAPVIASVEPLSGVIGKQVTISGSNFSADTSEVTVIFNETEAEVIGSTDTEIQTRVPEGAVSGPITVSVSGKSTAGPEFEVITTGTLIVEISTSGSDIDPDGYMLTIGAGDGVRTGVNDTITRSGMKEGTYEILLGDIETNCYLNQELPNPRTATIEAGATTTVEYIITCEGLNEPPVAAFAVSCTNLTCDLDASESSDADGSITAYDWILGDGNTATGQVVSHSYETSGTYTIELTVTDNEGATNLVSQDVTVTVPEITDVSPLSGVPGSTVIISGSNFSSVASENNVQFNGVRAELNSVSETEISAIVPAEATTGTITVTVNGYTAEGPVFTVEAVQEPKTLEVVVSTQGSMQDEDGYTLSVTGQDDRIVKPNDNVIYSDILENSVQVELTGVAENCAVDGENPRTVNLDNSDNAGFTEFIISCSAPAPEITGISPTSGTTGSEVVITGSNFSPTISDNIVEFNGVRAELSSATGTELLAIVPGTATSGVVTVKVNEQTAIGPEFTVIEVGSLEVNTSTSGSDLDTDGYILSVESLSDQSIGINETKLLGALPTGSYLVELSGIAANCQVSEELPNPRTLEVTANSTTATSFDVFCSAINEPPVAVIESFCLALDCGFTGTPSSDSDGEIVSYDWNFGDGITAAGDSVNHTYESEGTYDVELVVTDDKGATDTAVQTIDIVLPEISAIDPLSGPVGTEVTVTGTGFSDIAGGNAVGFTSGETIVAGEIVSESTTELVAVVPADAATGPVYVAVGEYVTEGPVFTVEQTSEPKTLEVVVSTDGPAGDGYTLSVTGQDARFVEPNSSTLYTGILENEVSVELTGLGGNCTVDGENPRLVNLNNSDNAGFTAFNVTCTGPAPTIESITPDSGTTGTQVTITGSNFSLTASDNIVTFNGVRAELNSVSANELIAFVPFNATTGPVEVTVNGQTATGPTFAVITTGRLEVNISTTGTSIDPDGYGLILDGGAVSAINVNDFVAYDDLSEGSHSIELTDIASNCFITQDRTNPYDVGVTAGDTTVTNIDVQCNEPAPAINSINPTSGPTGSEVVINGTNFSSVATENNVQFNGVRAELNTATETELRAIVPGSATTGPVTVTVNGQTATGPTFSVTATGSIQVNISTVGSVPDPDGYEIILDQEKPQLVDINDSYIFNSVETGEHTIELASIAENCSITNGTSNPTGVTVYLNEPTQVTYELSCDEISGTEKILFHGGDTGSQIFMMDPDGSSVQALTKSTFPNFNPVASYAGDRIVYVGGSDFKNVRVMNSDGSNITPITSDPILNPNYVSWSPKDAQIAFVNDNGKSDDIYTVNPDGSNLTQITSQNNLNEEYVHWSPVNNVLLFTQRDPAVVGSNDLFLMNSDGTNQRRITKTSGYYKHGRISPDGNSIVYVNQPRDCEQVFSMSIDGSNVKELTGELDFGCQTIGGLDWSPDGSNIVFQTNDGGANSQIWVMPSDASSAPKVISNTPDHPTYLALPTWGN